MTLFFAIILSILIIIAASAFLILYWALIYRPHPRLEGRLRVPGLRAKVEVLRDRWGVPHIYADTEADLWFAQGFVQAQDRLWQMELMRRVAAGRMAEGAGEEAVLLDRFARIIGFRRAAEAQQAYLNEDTRTVLESYCAGINAFLGRYRNRLPLEFTLLGIQPEPWTPVDTISISMLLGWSLSHNWREELVRVGLFIRLGPERAAELLPDYPSEHAPIFPGELRLNLSHALLSAYDAMHDYVGIRPQGQGSNSWVVHGERSISGKPLLANDPHLAVSIPGIWHLCHLETRDAQVRLIGASIPGGPGVLLGHNHEIAWGATAAMPDTMDLYVEQRHPQKDDHFAFAGGWEQARTWEEEITVKGQSEPIRQRVTLTRHGPLITDLLSEAERNYPPLAIQWSGYAPGSNLNALIGFTRATDWSSFRQATAELVTPALNLVYADRQGNIGAIAAGKVPVRAQGDGLVPAPGYTGTHEWTGYIPAEAMPQAYNPDQGLLLTANHAVVGDNYPYWWGVDLDPGYRARRIAQLLRARPKHSLREFQNMQLDTYSNVGRTLAPYFTLIDPVDTWERRAQKALLEWNYRMDRDSMAALVFEMVLYHLLQLVFADKLGPLSDDYLGVARLRPIEGGAFSYHAVVKLTQLLEQPESWWFGEGSTGRARNREELLSEALTRAVATMKAEISDDARRWQWGRLHQILWIHPLSVLRPLKRLLNRGPYPVSGSVTTINSQHWEFSLPMRTVTVAPIYRMVVDLDNWDRSRYVATPGQNGLPGHRFYDNLMHIWLEGDTIPMAFSRQKVEQLDPLYRLDLTP